MKAKTQKEAIEMHLKEFGHITPLDALKEYGCFRLSNIIYQLKKSGLKIETIRTSQISRYGNKCNFATYILK